jgi:hypothetical protein
MRSKLNEEYLLDSSELDLEETEKQLARELENSLEHLELLKKEKELIEDPEKLSKVIFDEVWNQFGNQIGMNLTNETLIQKYNKEHPESYSELASSVMKDPNYIKANKEMSNKQKQGKLQDAYTGKQLENGVDKANLDHVIPRKEIYENNRRKQANLSVAELANRNENLKPTNESLNKSKGAKSNSEYLKNRKQRECDLKNNNIKKNKKIEDSNKNSIDKQREIEKNNKRLNDKLSADENLMRKEDKNARDDFNKTVAKNATKQIGKKAAKDALKAMAISALFALSKDILNGLIKFFKNKSKSFELFLKEMKVALNTFFSKFKNLIKNASDTFISTIISEIFGPIVSMFKKLTSFIKQGVSCIREAISYLLDKNNKNKPLSIKIAQIGKIITTAIAGGSALILGEVFEKSLMSIPIFNVNIPLLGTLANVVGMFLSSLFSGLIGAVVINLIDKFINKKLKQDQQKSIVESKNNILNIQENQIYATENDISVLKSKTKAKIFETNNYGNQEIEKSLNNIHQNNNYEITKIDSIDNLQEKTTVNEEIKKLQQSLNDII